MAATRGSRRRALRHPRAHWGVLVLLIVLTVAGLGLSGYSTHHVGGGSAPPGSTQAVSGLPPGTGSILDLTGDDIRSVATPPGTVVLTFDDGPDPRWTPEILDVLAEEDVPATFFPIGARAGAEPALTERIHQEGHEIGSHTFTHRDIGDLSPWERELQLALTQVELAASAGIHTSLFRPPYSATTRSVSREGLADLEQVAEEGYLIVLSDLDSRDWRRPGTDEIVEASTPEAGTGAIILMHDGGGDRSQTVEALRELIPDLKRRGFTFRTVSDVVQGGSSVGSRAGERPATDATRTASWSLVALQQVSGHGVDALQIGFLVIGLLTVIRIVAVVVLASRHVRTVRRRPDRRGFAPPVTILVPAYNEEAGVASSVTSLAGSDYPGELEVIVIDDGSTDGTSAAVEALDLPNVRLIAQANAGKPGALNTGVAAAAHDLIVTVDGDTVFEPDTVRYLVQPFAKPDVGAVSGNTKVVNRDGLLGRWQHLEYVMGFNLDRRMYESLDCMPTVPGAIGAFRRQALADAGGVSDDTLAEDTDLTMGINRAGWQVVYEERAIAWTEAPSSVSGLWRQRYRWSYGTMQAMWKHRGAVLDRDHPNIGRRALPYLFLFQVLLPLLAPLIDLWTIYGLVFLDPVPVLAAWLAFNLVQVAIAAYAFRLDHERLRPLWSMPLQQLFYRQLMYLVVIQSAATAIIGVRLPWQRIERTGAINPDAEADTGPPTDGPDGPDEPSGPDGPVGPQDPAADLVIDLDAPAEPVGAEPAMAEAVSSGSGRPG